MLELMGWQCRSWDGNGCHGLMVELRAMLELMVVPERVGDGGAHGVMVEVMVMLEVMVMMEVMG